MHDRRVSLYAPLTLRPGVSRRLTVLVWTVHLAALPVLLPLPLPFWAKGGLLLGLAVSLYHSHRTHIARAAPRAIREAIWDETGAWRLSLAGGDLVRADLLPDSYVSLSLVVLNFRTRERRRMGLILPADALPPHYLRRLRVRLKLEYGKPDAAGSAHAS